VGTGKVPLPAVPTSSLPVFYLAMRYTCSSCGRFVPASQPVLLLEDPATREVIGFYHRTCIAGAERLAMQRPGELDLTVVRRAGPGEGN
jgi:hypothetical protein